MNDLFLIAVGAGLQDGLNPCIFMTCAVFIAHGLSLKPSSLRMGRLHIIFGLVYAISLLAFNFGPPEILVFQKNFTLIAKISYFILGVWAFISGILFFKDWFLLRRGAPVKDWAGGEKKPLAVVNVVIVYLATVILAVILGLLAALWPVNSNIMLLGNEMLLRGQWHTVIPLLTGYVVVSMWPLWFVWAFLSIKDLRPSLLKIVCAAVFFTASSSMIFIFK